MKKAYLNILALTVGSVLAHAEAPYIGHVDSEVIQTQPKAIETSRRCPIVFMNRVIKDSTETAALPFMDYFKDPVAKKCAGNMLTSFKSPEELESVLANHPMTKIPGSNQDFVSKCLKNPEALKKAGLNRPLTPAEQTRIVSDYYFTMTRLRTGWDTLAGRMAELNSHLGRKPLLGIRASEARIPGSMAIVKNLENCKEDNKAIDKIMADGISRASRLKSDAEEMKKAVSSRGGTLSNDQALQIVGSAIPYATEPQVKKVLIQTTNGEKVDPAKIREAYSHDILALSHSYAKALESLDHVAACINSEDPSCFSDAWWQKWGKTLRFDFQHDAQTMLSENADKGKQQIPSFDLDGFLNIIRDNQMKPIKGESPQQAKKRALQSMLYLNNAQCMAVHRENFDEAKDFIDNQLVNVGFIGASLGAGALTKGMVTGFPEVAKTVNTLQAWKPGWFAKMGIKEALNVPAEKTLFQPLVSGSAAKVVKGADGAINAFWLGFGVPMAIEGCHKFFDAAHAKALSKIDPACHKDFVSETIQFGDYFSCAMMSAFGGMPLLMHAMPHVLGKKAGPDGFEITKGVRNMQSIGKSWDPYFVLDLPRGTQDANLIQSKFKEWVKQYHPDLHKNSAEATLALARINWAKDALMAKASKTQPVAPATRAILPKKNLK